ncbi:hypothetical protein BC834DRAFT_965728 [Gloeopeniophorella convolvens]|nr:hypothetical protein BC834DRAFT_965728 [Gloeopeniophorella convolvens]
MSRPRPSLPASSSDFALRASSSSLQSPTDDPFNGVNPLFFRFRRPSLLAPKYISDSRLASPLSASFSSPLRSSSASDVDRERIWADSGSTSGSSENATPPLNGSEADKDPGTDSDSAMKTSRPQTPPPRPASSSSMDVLAEASYHPHLRRLAQPPVPAPLPAPVPRAAAAATPLTPPRVRTHAKLPRILSLVSESARPDENEVKSEAQFQRLVASFSELPMAPRTPRGAAPSDRGRYPEAAAADDERAATPSDDSDYDEPEPPPPFAFAPPAPEPLAIRTRTPAASVSGSLCGDDPPGESPGAAMDVDSMPPSLFGSPAAASLHQWRYTPPPTASSAVRTSKRKYDDRFDPYPTSSKRRAVSPSVTYLRETHTSLSPIYIPRAGGAPRGPIAVPVASSSAAGSVASSPISHGGALPFASPTLRATMSLASPIARPKRMSRRIDGEDREVDGTGEAVNGLSLA